MAVVNTSKTSPRFCLCHFIHRGSKLGRTSRSSSRKRQFFSKLSKWQSHFSSRTLFVEKKFDSSSLHEVTLLSPRGRRQAGEWRMQCGWSSRRLVYLSADSGAAGVLGATWTTTSLGGHASSEAHRKGLSHTHKQTHVYKRARTHTGT